MAGGGHAVEELADEWAGPNDLPDVPDLPTVPDGPDVP